MTSGCSVDPSKRHVMVTAKALKLRWIKEAWGIVPPETIRKSFKKCGINSALDGTEDHLFAADSDDGDEPFEGFGEDDVEIGEQVYNSSQFLTLTRYLFTKKYY